MKPARLLRTLAIGVAIAPVLSSFQALSAAGRGGTVRGVVRVAATWQPIAGAVVRLAELDRTTTSDSRGSFEIQRVPLGRYTLIVRHDPLETATRTVTLRSHAVELDIELQVKDGRREALDAWAVSGFFQNAIRMGPVTVTPGVCVERYTQHRTLQFAPNLLAPERESDGRTLVLPGISVLYDGLPATQIYAGMHRGYSPAIARTEDFPLLPETGVDTQLGVRSRPLRGLTIELGAFSNRVRNTIVKKTFTDALGQNVFVNSGDSRMRGIDVSGRIESQPLTGSRLNAFLQTAYGYTRALFTAVPIAGRRVPEVPLHSAA